MTRDMHLLHACAPVSFEYFIAKVLFLLFSYALKLKVQNFHQDLFYRDLFVLRSYTTVVLQV